MEELRESTVELLEIQREMARETEQAMRQSREETDSAIRELSSVFTSQCGKLVEAWVEPGCVDQFRNSGIAISRSLQRAEWIDREGRQMEIDVLLINGDEVVAIEVKASLKVGDVEEHEDRLE
jgi:hypothetical protein